VPNHDHKETLMSNNAPTPRQLRYLRFLANRSGTTFTNPSTRRQASAEIDRLRGLSSRRRVQDTDFAEDPERRLVYATGQQPGEAYGYGSSASWQRPLRKPHP
jgi:hypothetical protein